ncbi:hypothetical protein K450DRAFT_229421 [Umbelopsis ramanniana AG]|uniref:Uncharacterized protein n=1 Tax=Umbelopsis ramanniana AG TaxID=1314678 RepID=A0AAD5HH31_UMBRA|nr:uncharacterized protein K450DRAFT_229421 [Umbelopsis ramanniana AG]KAI8582181.1 hypothetical protein K450DRAFT_229421 [Umbelopsis ramanniana AG]
MQSSSLLFPTWPANQAMCTPSVFSNESIKYMVSLRRPPLSNVVYPASNWAVSHRCDICNQMAGYSNTSKTLNG